MNSYPTYFVNKKYVLKDIIIDSTLNNRVFFELLIKKIFIDKQYFGGEKNKHECLHKYEDNFGVL